MQPQELEEAIKSDLKTIATLKMGFVSAKDLYGRGFELTFKLSLLLLVVNTVVHLVLKPIGFFDADLTGVGLILGGWFMAFLVSLALSTALSRLILIGKLIKGRLKTAALMKATFMHLGWAFLGIYSVAYALATIVVMAGTGNQPADLGLLLFVTVFSQLLAFIVASGITGLLSGIELDRLGLGAVFNILSEFLSKTKKSALHMQSGEDD